MNMSTTTAKGRSQAALKAWTTRRAAAPPEAVEEKRLRQSMKGAINFASRRQIKKAEKGRTPVQVTVTVEQLMEKLRLNGYRCALTGLPFWTDDSDRFGPTMPSLDRIDNDGDYNDENIRVVLLGVNSLRGRGSDDDMYRIAKALAARASKPTDAKVRSAQ
jgi:hypothetical protein